jgi:hypothetical protein
MPETVIRTSGHHTEDYERMTTLIADAAGAPERAQGQQADTGLHSMSGPPLATPEWVIASWRKAVEERESENKPTRKRSGRR